MKQNKIKLIVLLFLVVEFPGMQAQEATTTAGGNISGGGGSVCYSVGQVGYTNNTGTNGSVAQGVQQPFKIAVVTSLYEAKGITIQYSVYPNPVTDILILKINSELSSLYMVSLYDINGRCLEVKKIIGIETDIDMKNRLPATYFLKVTDGNIVVKTFKIIKNE
jgi:CRISPR/Cas system-associated endoribonuclease Cas2